jgi:hypothetical protein
MNYCQPVYESPLPGTIRTRFFCDWNQTFYESASQCVQECSDLLISKSEASFIIILILSLFVLFIVLGVLKAILE